MPLTSEPGFEENASLSPDGKQVAYSWNGPKQDNFDIYVKLIGLPSLLRLTTIPHAISVRRGHPTAALSLSCAVCRRAEPR